VLRIRNRSRIELIDPAHEVTKLPLGLPQPAARAEEALELRRSIAVLEERAFIQAAFRRSAILGIWSSSLLRPLRTPLIRGPI
jgi:hypothetical protein